MIIRVLAPLLGVIAVGLSVPLVQVGTALAVYEAAGLLSPAAGWIIDRVGAARVAVGALWAFSISVGTTALAPSIWVFGSLLVIVGVATISYETAAISWISNRTAFEHRASWLGRFELSWPAGLLLGLPLAAVLALWSWRYVFLVASLSSLVNAVVLTRQLGRQRSSHPSDTRPQQQPWKWRTLATGWSTVLGFGLAACAVQITIVVFGVWLTDRFGFSTLAIGVVGFMLGGADLAVGALHIRFTDQVGKARSATVGMVGMVIGGLTLAATESILIAGVAALIIIVASQEITHLATKPLLGEIDVENAGFGYGIGFGAAAAGRSVGAFVGTVLYSWGGASWAAASTAAVAGFGLVIYLAAVRDPQAARQREAVS